MTDSSFLTSLSLKNTSIRNLLVLSSSFAGYMFVLMKREAGEEGLVVVGGRLITSTMKSII